MICCAGIAEDKGAGIAETEINQGVQWEKGGGIPIRNRDAEQEEGETVEP